MCLAVGLQAVAGFVQQSSYRARADGGCPWRVSSLARLRVLLQVQRKGDCGVPSGEGIDQLVQSSQQPQVDFRTRFASRTGPADTVDGMRLPRVVQFPQPRGDGIAIQSGSSPYSLYPTITENAARWQPKNRL